MDKFSIANKLSEMSNILDEIESKDGKLLDILDDIDKLLIKSSNRLWDDDYEVSREVIKPVYIRVIGSEDYFRTDRFYCSDYTICSDGINFPDLNSAYKFVDKMNSLYPDISYLVISENHVISEAEVIRLWRNVNFKERWEYEVED